jgi:WD40 repeat protein
LGGTIAARNASSNVRRRAITIGVPTFTGDDDLAFASGRVQGLGGTLTELGFDAVVHSEPALSSKEIGAVVRKEWEECAPDDLLIVHVLSHGGSREGSNSVYVLGGDGVVDGDAEIAHWLRRIEEEPARPRTLFLLDLCFAGKIARQTWQQATEAEAGRAWVIAACGENQVAWNGRFTEALINVLQALSRGELDIDPALEHVPLGTVARAVRQEVNRLFTAEETYGQTVTASLVDMSTDPQLPFFLNRAHRGGDTRAQLRTTLDPGVLPFLDDLDEGLDVLHFLERAAGMGGLASGLSDLVGCFTGRDRQLKQLSPWMNNVSDGGRPPSALSVVTGSPGVGKSALLGIVVCAAHEELREATRPFWFQVAQAPYSVKALAAVHARRLSVPQIVASISRQLGLGGGSEIRDLRARLRNRTGEVPVLVIDAVDEANDGPALAAELLLPLAGDQRAEGQGPVVRMLIGTRDYPEYRQLLELAAAGHSLIDLNQVPADILRRDLRYYIDELLGTSVAYRTRDAVRGGFAGRVADRLVAVPGPFLISGLYARNFITTTVGHPVTDPREAERLGEQVPRDLPSVFALDLAAQTDQPWFLQIILALATAQGQGMPASVIARVAGAFSAGQPSVTEVLDTLQVAKVYLRQSIGDDHTSVYRLFHQGLVDYLKSRLIPALDKAVFHQLIAPVRARSWDAAEPYLVHHVIEHAQKADELLELIADPGVFAVPELAAQLVELAGSRPEPEQRLIAVQQRASGQPRVQLALEAIRAGLTAFASQVADAGGAPLTWRPAWVFRHDRPNLRIGRLDTVALEEHVSLDGAQAAWQSGFAIANDGTLALASANGVRLFSGEGRRTAHIPDWASPRDHTLAITPDAKNLIVGTVDGVVYVRNVMSNDAALVQHWSGTISTVAISSDAKAVLAGDELDIQEWELGTGRVTTRPKLGGRMVIANGGSRPTISTLREGPDVTAGTLSANGSRLITGHWDGTIQSATSGIQIAPAAHQALVSVLAADAFGRIVASGAADGTVRVWDLASGQSLLVCDQHERAISAVAISAAGTMGACADAGGTVHRWRLSVSSPTAAAINADRGPGAAGLTTLVRGEPGSTRTVLTLDGDGHLCSLDLATGRQTSAPLDPEQFDGIALDRIWPTYVFGGWYSCIQTREGSRWLLGPGELTRAIPVLRWLGVDANQFATAKRSVVLRDRIVQVGISTKGTLAVREVAHASFEDLESSRLTDLADVACAPIGDFIVAAAGARDGSVEIWDLETRQLIEGFDVGDPVLDITLDAEGWLIVTTVSEVIGFRLLPGIPSVVIF